jgi:hypothetical protein
LGDSEPTEVMLVIIGAGASYDCIPGGPNGPATPIKVENLPALTYPDFRPPLTQQLVAEGPLTGITLDRYKACRSLVDYLRRELADEEQAPTLEHALHRYGEDSRYDSMIDRHMTAFRFYLRDLLWSCTDYVTSPELIAGVTNYVTLVRRLTRWAGQQLACVCYVSFNFDLLLENAVASHYFPDFDPFNRAEYLNYARFKILKPHGSVHWAWPVNDGSVVGARSVADDAVRLAPEVGVNERELRTETTPYHRLDLSRAGNVPIQIPALALPVAEKTGFVWPQEQSDYLDGLQGRVQRVLTIGWRAAEPHFTQKLRRLVRAGARVLVVTGNDSPDQAEKEANGITRELHDTLDRVESFNTLAGGFSSLEGSRQLSWLLE